MKKKRRYARRKGIYFDLNTNALKGKHPSGDYTRAYDDVRSFLEKNGFIHQQGTGYESLLPMTEIEINVLLNKLKKTYPWLKGCVSTLVVANVPKKYDYTEMFNVDDPDLSISDKSQQITKTSPAKQIHPSFENIIKNAETYKSSFKNISSKKNEPNKQR